MQHQKQRYLTEIIDDLGYKYFISKVVMASKASRLLKSVRLMLAREKSYDVSQAEEGKRGRKAGRTAYHHRFGDKQTRIN